MKNTPPARSLAVSILALLFAFTLPGAAHAASGTIGPHILGLGWSTYPPEPCATEPTRLVFDVCECEVELLGAERDSVGPIVVRLRAHPGVRCPTCIPDSASVALGTLLAGMHSAQVRIEIEYSTPPDSAWPSSPVHDEVTFAVGPDCSHGGGIPYLSSVVVENPPPCPGCPSIVCPGDSIDVFLGGTFPDDCTWLESVELLPNPVASPLPAPPVIRLIYGINSCIDRPCSMFPVDWSTRVRLPELPSLAGVAYQLSIEAYRRDVCLSDPRDELLGRTAVPFVVADSCPPPPGPPCLNVRWVGHGGGGCTDFYAPGEVNIVALFMGSTVPISGVEGRLVLDTGALRVTDITTTRPGWHVSWNRTPEGDVRFVAFKGTAGEPIPASPGGEPQFLLGIWYDPLPDQVLPARVHLQVRDLIASDPRGVTVWPCPYPAEFPGPDVAVLCRDAACDANSDGRRNILDLVTMVNCLVPGDPNCTGPPLERIDCEADGIFDLDDVFCCARHMLGGEGGPPPPDSLQREAPEIQAWFGLPRAAADGTIEVRLELGSLSIAGVAAARLDVAYPDDRYELVRVTYEMAPSWWTLHQVDPGRVRVALLDLWGTSFAAPAAVQTRPAPSGFVLHLRLKAGATPGGELVVTSHEFAAGDGMALVTPNAHARVAMGALGSVALSAPRPNPFAATAAFTLTLPVTGGVDVGVFDVAGRRVATLLREASAPAGVYALSWNGAEAGGARARGGVYFVRVVTGQGDTSRKILFLPGGTR